MGGRQDRLSRSTPTRPGYPVRQRLGDVEPVPRAGDQALQKILTRHDGERILIAAHGETIEAANNLLLALPQNTCLRLGFVTDHASVTRWQRPTNRFGRTIWQLVTHNDTRHLQPER